MRFRTLVLALTLVSSALQGGTTDVQKYSKNSSLQWVWGMLSINELSLEGNEKILDVGCGDGKISAYLSTLVPEGEVVGIELDQAAVSFASKHYSHPNLTFDWGDAASLSYREEFDLIVSFLCLNWIQDVQTVIKSFDEALKPGGTAVITLPSPQKESKWRHIFQEIIGQDKYKPYLHLFEFQNRSLCPEDFEGFCENTDLHVKKILHTKTAVIFHSPYEVKNWLLGLNPRLIEMPAYLLDSFVADYVWFLTQIFPQAGDKRIYVFPEKVQIWLEKGVISKETAR